jgi:hypothetical protein
MSRTPPDGVRKVLRDEVGFGCPIPGCGSPYLECHHFDPPWRIKQHHDVKGMIALCREHHIQADQGAFTIDQLHAYKKNAKENWAAVKGKFNWMRNRLLAVVGGNFFYETPIILQHRGKPIIWIDRNESGYLLLNFFMLSTTGEPRTHMRNNEWFSVGGEEDIECPPSARRLKVSYPNGDLLTVEFFELESVDDVKKRYHEAPGDKWPVEFPITGVEVTNVVAGSGLEFNAQETTISTNVFKGNFFARCGVAIAIS